jgi:hypothetical protein
VRLARGDHVQAIISGLEPDNLARSEVFKTLSVWLSGESCWFRMARYFDPWNRTQGPKKLAKALGLSLEIVFPIKFDLTGIFKRKHLGLIGTFLSEPKNKLSKDEIIELSME